MGVRSTAEWSMGPSLKWVKTGPNWFRLSDGSVVHKIDDNIFKITPVSCNTKGVSTG
jgi:hypothetical protein